MTPLPCVLHADELAGDVLLLLTRSRLAALPVVGDDGRLLGIVTEDSLAQGPAARRTANATVGQVMKHEVACLDEAANFNELVASFARDAATPIVITHEGHPTGLAVPENLVLLGGKLTREGFSAAVAFSPTSEYLAVPDLSPAETA